MKRAFAIAILPLTAIIAAACGSSEPQAEPGEPVAGVTVEAVAPATIDDYYEAAGTVRSKTTSVIAAKVMGTVTAIHAVEGTHVKRGQTLLEIDDRDVASQLRMAEAGVSEANEALAEVQQAIAAAEANRKLANATYERFRTLHERRSVSQQEFEEVEAKHAGANAMADSLHSKRAQVLSKIEQAKAAAAGARAYHSYARVVAPFDGIVAAKMIDAGSMAAPGHPLMTVEDPKTYRVEASVDDSVIRTIRPGDPAQVRIESAGALIPGRVAEVVPAADPMSRKYTVKVDLLPAGDGTEHDLRSGRFARVQFLSGRREALTVPPDAIVRQGQLTGVWAVDANGIAHMRLVTVGRSASGRVEVLSGLAAGDRIVTAGFDKVRDGVRVAS
jgi:membrane fusion protein, multidrug efflux system